MATQSKDISPAEATTKRRKSKTLKGFRDIMPRDAQYWQQLRTAIAAVASSYSFGRVELPLLESTTYYSKIYGRTSTEFEQQVWTVQDESTDKLTLLPESRPSLVRAYIDHNAATLPQPVKWFTETPVFQQSVATLHKYRQGYETTFETLGSADPLLDAQLIFINYNILTSLGLPATVHVNSIGSVESRDEYKKAILAYLRPKKSELAEEDRKVYNKNPLALFKDTPSEYEALVERSPHILDFLTEHSQQHFMKVLEYLDELDVPYFLSPRLVGQQDYFTETVFRISIDRGEDAKLLPVVYGGRHEGLFEVYGGEPTPACGSTMVMDKVAMALRQMQQEENVSAGQSVAVCDIFVAQLGEDAKKKSMVLFEKLRASGLCVSENLAQEGLKSQLEAANKLGVKYALILGQKEIMDGTIMIRDMENGIQEVIDFKKVVVELEKRLSKQLKVEKQNEA